MMYYSKLRKAASFAVRTTTPFCSSSSQAAELVWINASQI